MTFLKEMFDLILKGFNRSGRNLVLLLFPTTWRREVFFVVVVVITEDQAVSYFFLYSNKDVQLNLKNSE